MPGQMARESYVSSSNKERWARSHAKNKNLKDFKINGRFCGKFLSKTIQNKSLLKYL